MKCGEWKRNIAGPWIEYLIKRNGNPVGIHQPLHTYIKTNIIKCYTCFFAMH